MTATETAPAVLWSDCAHCGESFSQPRRRGRPAVTCSEACRKARGRNGDVRLDLATNGTGAVMLDYSTRQNGTPHADALAFDVLGDPEGDEGGFQGWSVAFRIPPNGGATRDYWRRDEAKHVGATERRYGLAGGLYVGETSPGIGRTIGAADAPWDWAERLDRERAWRF